MGRTSRILQRDSVDSGADRKKDSVLNGTGSWYDWIYGEARVVVRVGPVAAQVAESGSGGFSAVAASIGRPARTSEAETTPSRRDGSLFLRFGRE